MTDTKVLPLWEHVGEMLFIEIEKYLEDDSTPYDAVMDGMQQIINKNMLKVHEYFASYPTAIPPLEEMEDWMRVNMLPEEIRHCYIIADAVDSSIQRFKEWYPDREWYIDDELRKRLILTVYNNAKHEIKILTNELATIGLRYKFEQRELSQSRQNHHSLMVAIEQEENNEYELLCLNGAYITYKGVIRQKQPKIQCVVDVGGETFEAIGETTGDAFKKVYRKYEKSKGLIDNCDQK